MQSVLDALDDEAAIAVVLDSLREDRERVVGALGTVTALMRPPADPFHERLSVSAGGGEDGPDASGEIGVGVDQPEDRPFALHGVVPGHGGFDLLDTTEHGWDGSDLRSGGRR